MTTTTAFKEVLLEHPKSSTGEDTYFQQVKDTHLKTTYILVKAWAEEWLFSPPWLFQQSKFILHETTALYFHIALGAPSLTSALSI